MIPTESAFYARHPFEGNFERATPVISSTERPNIETSLQPEPAVVLILDDDAVVREIASTILSMAGCAVHLAPDGPAALHLLDSSQCLPDVILVDALLPGLSGAGLIEALRRRCSSRIFFISANAPSEELVASTDGFLRKPFDECELLAAVGVSPRNPVALHTLKQARFVSQTSVLSPEMLEKLRQKMPESSVRKIYSMLVSDLSQKIQALEDALESPPGAVDMDNVRRIGHAIHGGCSMAGAMEAAALGAQLEAIPIFGSSSGSESASSILGDLRIALHALEGKFKTEFPA